MKNILEIDAALRSSDEIERWTAAAAAGDLVATNPKAVWSLVVAHGDSPIEDVRMAVASCMLEHLLEHYFEEYFILLDREVRTGKLLLGDTLRRCWRLGQAELPENSAKWDDLVEFTKAYLRNG